MSPAGEAQRQAWLESGDLLDVIAATGKRDGWPTEEVWRAQAKVREAMQPEEGAPEVAAVSGEGHPLGGYGPPPLAGGRGPDAGVGEVRSSR